MLSLSKVIKAPKSGLCIVCDEEYKAGNAIVIVAGKSYCLSCFTMIQHEIETQWNR